MDQNPTPARETSAISNEELVDATIVLRSGRKIQGRLSHEGAKRAVSHNAILDVSMPDTNEIIYFSGSSVDHIIRKVS